MPTEKLHISNGQILYNTTNSHTFKVVMAATTIVVSLISVEVQ